MLQVEKGLEGKDGASLNQVVYVISDMRSRDWPADEEATEKEGVSATLRRIADATSGCYLVDVGREDDVGNVYVEEIRSKEKALVAGVPADFEVTVRNAAKSEASNVKVKFVAGFQDGGETPLEETIERIPSGEAETVGFKFAFSREELESIEQRSEPARIRAEIVPTTVEGIDELEEDDKRFFAARVAPGIRTLIVDGDRLPERTASESFYLDRALSPPGDRLSGMAVDVVGESEFENLRLDDYQIIYLCNLYRIPDAGAGVPDDGSGGARSQLSRLQQLEKWVDAGGGLVIAVGDRVDDEVYNRDLYREGKGLMPLPLDSISGDVDETDWKYFDLEQSHPVMKAFEGQGGENFSEFVKIFRWWDCLEDEELTAKGQINIVARYTNSEKSPAVIEKAFGKGRVFMFTTPLDNDWSDWPQDYSFVPTMQELNKYLARKTSDDANVEVGDALLQSLDLTHFELEVGVKRPDDATADAIVNPADESSVDQVLYLAKYDDVNRQGFYQLMLSRRDMGGAEPMLFAANIDSREGDLMRANTREFQRKLGDANIQFVSQSDLLKINVEDARKHLWPWVLGLLVLVLFVEQFLGWLFGRKR